MSQRLNFAGLQEDQQLEAEFPHAVGLLKSAGPANGIDLTPLWERKFADGDAGSVLSVAPAVDNQAGKRSWLSLAAGLALGTMVGAFGAFAAQGRMSSISTVSGGEKPAVLAEHYNSTEGRLMTEALSALFANGRLTPDLGRRVSLELSRCNACHATVFVQRPPKSS